MTDGLNETLSAVLRGDATRLHELRPVSRESLVEACRQTAAAVSARDAVAIFENLASGRISKVQAQEWASFVRWGLVPGTLDQEYLKQPIEIPYADANENAIAEAVSRLDELGDIIDGEISEQERAELIVALLDQQP
jgi:hypothetical protein